MDIDTDTELTRSTVKDKRQTQDARQKTQHRQQTMPLTATATALAASKTTPIHGIVVSETGSHQH